MLRSILKLARIRILVTCYALVFVGSVAVGGVEPRTILALLVLVTWYIHAASANDYADRHIDKINLKNAKDRPLLSKDVSYKQMLVIHCVSGALALFLASFYGVLAVLATVGMLIINYAYSLKPIRLSDRGLISQLVLALGYVYFPFSLGYWARAGHEEYPWLLSFGLYLGFVGRLLLKDFRDVIGDKKHGKMTYVLRHGAKNTCILSVIFWFLGMYAVGEALHFPVGPMLAIALSLLQVAVLLRAVYCSESIDMQVAYIGLIAKAANVSLFIILSYLICVRNSSISKMEIQALPFAIGFIFIGLNSIKYKQLVSIERNT